METTEKHWSEEVLPVLDFETTGVDPFTDRIVSAALVFTGPDGKSVSYTSLVNPGVEVPESAAAVHGFSTEHLAEYGLAPREILNNIVFHLCTFTDISPEVPVIIFNASFDWPLLWTECKRHNVKYPDNLPNHPIFDPLVFSRRLNKYAKGGHKLEIVAQRYGYKHFDAHDAEADALATAYIARQMCKNHAIIRVRTIYELQALQTDMHHNWCVDMASYFARKGRTDFVKTEWKTGRILKS